MAAELTYLADGTANLFYSRVGGTPWHREGRPIEGEQQFDFEGAIAAFDYPLEKLPYYVPNDPSLPAEQQTFAPSPGASYVWRPDTKKVLGTVGSAYEIVGNRDAFEVLKPLVDKRLMALETGGVLRDGADAWLMVRWNLEEFGPEAREVFALDGGIQPYSTVMANHSGRRGIIIGQTPIRVVCANTLASAETDRHSRWETVTHKNGAKNRLAEAADALFGDTVRRYEVLAGHCRALMETTLTDEEFGRLVCDVVAPDPRKDPKFEPSAKLANMVVERAFAKRNELKRLWTEGKGHSGEKTAWYAAQSCYEFLDFNKALFPNRGGAWRTASLLTGEMGRMKDKVADRLVAFSLSA